MSAAAMETGQLPGLDRVLIWFNDPANWSGPNGLVERGLQHLLMTVVIVSLATVIAVPIGTLIGHTGRGAFLVSGTANVLRAIPGLGLLILLIVGVSPHIHIHSGLTSAAPAGSIPYLIPVVVVLLILAVPPILTGTYTGIDALDPALRDAARGTGLNGRQMVFGVELPCALPPILGGIRSSTLQVLASLTVAAYAPLVGGLGRLIVDGTQNITDPQFGYPAMVGAAVCVAVLAVVVDAVLARVTTLLTPRGLLQDPARTTDV